jgi:ppGpp synthetase/RelA/SpoT-type nucleotidyltranferase
MNDADELSRHVEQQVAAYERVRPVYSLFADILGASLTRITRELGLNAIVQVRAKEKSSFAEKAVRKRGTYPDAINQMTDLCGGRIITECKDDIEPLLRRVRECFEVLEAEDVLDRLGTGEFGYRSIHMIVALKRDALLDSLLGEALAKHFKDVTDYGASAADSLFQRRPPIGTEHSDSGSIPKFRAEIQLRTLLQHAWSAIGHDRIYKS